MDLKNFKFKAVFKNILVDFTSLMKTHFAIKLNHNFVNSTDETSVNLHNSHNSHSKARKFP